MADRRRIITMSSGGRPVLEVDLEVGGTFQAIKDTFAYALGQSNQMASKEPTRFGGQVIVGEQNDNGTVSWQALVQGSTPDHAAANIETLLAAANRTAQGRLLEWRPDSSTYSSYFVVAGPGSWKPNISWGQWQGAQSMVVDITFPVRPLVLWDPMIIGDDFAVDSLVDYTFDAATSADVAVDTGASYLAPVVGAALTVERRARHTVRGYKSLEGQTTVRWDSQTTTTGIKAGVLLRASAANTYIEVYVDDNGTNSRLRIDAVIGGTRTNRSSTNLAARIGITPFWVRGRVEGNIVYAEYWTAQPTPVGTPTLAPAGYTLTTGERAQLVAGYPGWSWIPQSAAALRTFEFRPFTYRSQALPQLISPLDQIPGTAPALADMDITTSGLTAWALIAWAVCTPGVTMPFKVIEAEAMTLTGGWSTSTQGGARGGTDVRNTSPGLYKATYTISASTLEPDDFTDGQVDLEVWARVLLTNTTVQPRIAASIGATINGTLINEQFTIEYGSTGKTLITPTIVSSVYRFVRVGTIPVGGPAGAQQTLSVYGQCAAGSTGPFGFDYVILVPARRRAAMVTGVDETIVQPFTPSTFEWTKRVRNDLSTLVGGGGQPIAPDAGLGGALIQPNPGAVSWLVKLSSDIPDDPTVAAALNVPEQTSHTATVQVNVTPRSFLLRGA